MKITPKLLDAANNILSNCEPWLGYVESGGLGYDAKLLAQAILNEQKHNDNTEKNKQKEELPKINLCEAETIGHPKCNNKAPGCCNDIYTHKRTLLCDKCYYLVFPNSSKRKNDVFFV